MEKKDSLKLKFEYPKDNRKTKYKDLEIFLTNKNFSPESYPEYIRNME